MSNESTAIYKLFCLNCLKRKNPCSLPLGAAERNMVLAGIRAVRSEATSARRQKHVQ